MPVEQYECQLHWLNFDAKNVSRFSDAFHRIKIETNNKALDQVKDG